MAPASVTIVGIDAATEPAKVGLALGVWEAAGQLTLVKVERPATRRLPAACVAEWLGGKGPFLLALDAPLGWPLELGEALAAHRAGQPLKGRADDLFRRRTDAAVQGRLGKRPFDVGADRIARTAHAALGLLGELRQKRGSPIPLAWSPDDAEGLDSVTAIEVYPAATLIDRAWPASSYKKNKPEELQVREKIVACLVREVRVVAPAAEVMRQHADALDAALCVLAGGDFLDGRAPGPSHGEEQVAAREGWIWVRGAHGRPSQA